MTALTSALALIPLAVGGDLPGNEIQSPMAQVIFRRIIKLHSAKRICSPYRIFSVEPEKRSINSNPSGDTSRFINLQFIIMKKYIYILCLSLIVTLPVFSQSGIKEVLKNIEVNNPTLQAGMQLNQAQKLEARTGIFLPNPTVE